MTIRAASHPTDFELRWFLPARLTVLSNRLTRQVARLYGARFKLSAPEWRTIAVLGQQGALSANAVVAQTAMDKVRVSRAVSKLLNSGLITRDTDPIDRRRAILKLTNSGQETYRQIIPLVQEVESEIMAALSGTELDGLEHALTQIEAALR
jgi:DNA-binding MarR family transcriptional regulator